MAEMKGRRAAALACAFVLAAAASAQKDPEGILGGEVANAVEQTRAVARGAKPWRDLSRFVDARRLMAAGSSNAHAVLAVALVEAAGRRRAFHGRGRPLPRLSASDLCARRRAEARKLQNATSDPVDDILFLFGRQRWESRLAGFRLHQKTFSRLARKPWPEDCLKQGAAQYGAILDELNAGRPVVVVRRDGGGNEPVLRLGLLLWGYHFKRGGVWLRGLSVRLSSVDKAFPVPENFSAGDAVCHFEKIASVLAPGEKPTPLLP